MSRYYMAVIYWPHLWNDVWLRKAGIQSSIKELLARIKEERRLAYKSPHHQVISNHHHHLYALVRTYDLLVLAKDAFTLVRFPPLVMGCHWWWAVFCVRTWATPVNLLKLYAAIPYGILHSSHQFTAHSLYSMEGILLRLNCTPPGLTGDQSYSLWSMVSLKKHVFGKLIFSCCNCFCTVYHIKDSGN